MSARLESLYRDAPVRKPEPIDASSIPDCGAGGIARLRAENDRREGRLWHLSVVLWLALSVCALGVAVFRQAPYILVIGFFAARDMIYVVYRNRGRTGLAKLAIEEIVRLQGVERIAREERLREAVASWTSDLSDAEVRLESTEWLTDRQHDALQEIRFLHDRRRSLLLEIEALRGDARAAS